MSLPTFHKKFVSKKKKICAKCNKLFLPNSNFQFICDVCCTYSCKQCNKIFISKKKRNIKFCSLECTNKWQETSEAKKQAHHKTIEVNGSGKVAICKTCGKLFYIAGWALKKKRKYCSHSCRDYKMDMKGINRVLRFPKKVEANQLECAGTVIVSKLKIPFKEQQVIGGKFVVDVLLPEQKIIIQWDGDFWHCNPKVYPEPIANIQIANIKRDKACNSYLQKCGYSVIRFWESDVHNNSDYVLSELQKIINKFPKDRIAHAANKSIAASGADTAQHQQQ